MRVYHSNRLELLAEDLASLIATDPADPLTPERIVVPHPTMGRWLQLELARALGIAANMKFELPAEFAWSVLREAVPSLAKGQGFDPGNLRWHLFELLPEFSRSPAGREVQDFLGDGDERKRFELADKLAAVYDRCINFRPDWIRDWERGAAPHWQARLWRSLAAKVPEQHWVQALDAFQREISKGTRPESWPRRAFFFNVSALSPSYLQLLEQLGRDIDLNIFLFNPSEAYWADIRSKRESLFLTGGEDPKDLHYEEGNELLAAWGRGGRDTFEALSGDADAQHGDPPSGGASRLVAVQQDIQALCRAQDAPAMESGQADCSLQIHCCHSAMREAEVLHDRLLDLLESNSDIEPADIMILTPDLARYGPVIAAVFEAEGRIPVTLSRFRAADSPTTRAFFDLLSLPGSRYGAEAVLAPLEAPSLRARFGIGEGSLPTIRNWIKEAGIRRGIDADGSGSERTPALPGNTWREGLRRMLMGYAAGDTDDLSLGLAPCVIRGEAGFDAGEDDFETLGRFISYCESAFELRSLLAQPPGAKQWAQSLLNVLNKFFDDGSVVAAFGGFEAARAAADEVKEIRTLIENFANQAGRANCRIPFDVVRQALKEAAGGPPHRPAQLADGAAIGRLASGQILPAKVICAVGMNGEGFPRNPPRHTFDLIANDKRRPGDRDVRHEDRFAFLEALLAARAGFIVTYTGRDQRDDSEIPPSVVVDELVDYLAARFPDSDPELKQSEDREAVRDSFRIRHPLQPFSPRYFAEDQNLFSYSKTMLDAARISRNENRQTPNRFIVALPEQDQSLRNVTLSQLARFFSNPAAGFLRERFGTRLSGEEEPIDEAEPLQLDGLEQYSLREEIRTRLGDERGGEVDPESVRSLLLASGSLPYGSFGALAYDHAFELTGGLNERLLPHAEALAAEPVNIDFEIGGFQIAGAIPNIAEDHMVWWRNGKLRTRYLIEIRLRQLAWIAAGNNPLAVKTIWIDGELEIPAPDPQVESILPWIEAWWRGLSEPLRFFPESSFACAKSLAKDGDEIKAISEARKKWIGNPFQSVPGECDDLNNRLLWNSDGEGDPLCGDFSNLAQNLLKQLASQL